MKTTNHKIIFSILLSSILLMLILLFADALLPVSRFLHLATVICLCLALFITSFDVKSRRKQERAGHTKEMEGMQREVERTIRRYTSLLEGAGNAIFVFNADSGILEEMNRKATDLLGFSKEEMASLRGKDLILPTDQAKFIALVFRVKRRGRGHSDCLTFQRKNGAHLLGEVDARLIDLGDAKVVHAIVRDITFRHRYLREIQKRNHELVTLNKILASTNSDPRPEAVLEVTLQETLDLFGAEGGTIHLVEADGKTLQLTTSLNISDNLKGKLIRRELGSDAHCRMLTVQRCHVINDFDPNPCHIAREAIFDGWQSICSVPLFAKNELVGIMHIMNRQVRQYAEEELRFLATIGNQTGMVVAHARLFAELTWKNEEMLRSHRLLERSSNRLSVSQGKLRRNLALVEQANLDLERLDRMKSHFLGMVSHEFNTPLTSILGGTELLINSHGPLAGEQEREVLEMIHTSGARLNEIVTDLLKTVKLEAKTHSITKTPLHLARIVEVLYEQLTPLLQKRSQTIVFVDLEQLPYFNGDPDYLEEVLSELLINAMKFTLDGGEIILAGRVVDLEELESKQEILCRFNKDFYEQIADSCYLEIEVRDSGIGIDAAEQLNIFEKFYEIGDIRHHSSGKHKFQGKGAGLGLAIVKGMVEAHGGMVWVESPSLRKPEEVGTSFFLLLPLEETSTQPEFPFMQE